MKKAIVLLTSLTLAGCAVNDYAQMSVGSGVPEMALKENCKKISCSYDKLKDRVQATASDLNILLSLGGGETRNIQFTWVSGSNKISADVISTNLYESWSFIESAEIYVGKEMVATISGSVDRVVGHYNDVARKHEKVETITGLITINEAEKIALADYKTVTIRFYGKGGYKDVELPREHDLINVVKLAQSV